MKHVIAHPLRLINGAFMLIAEPRVERVFQFLIYALLGYGGGWILVAPPDTFTAALSEFHLVMFGLFAVVGSACGMVAVLPGIWWLERAGIASLVAGLAIYWALGIGIGSSTFVAVMTLAFILKLAQRWGRIRGAALAPIEVRPVGVGG